MGIPIEKQTHNSEGSNSSKTFQTTNKGVYVVAVMALLTLLAVSAPHIARAFSLSTNLASFAQALTLSLNTEVKTEYVLYTPQLHNPDTTPALRAALNVDPNPAKGGGDIIITGGVALVPEIGPSGTLADIEVARPGADKISIYVVREGDTLSQIAELFGVSTNTIVWANDLRRGNVIRPGETLVVLPVSGVRHTVAQGDTLKSIAKRYKSNLADVLEFNGISEDAKLVVGDTITVPYGVVPQTTSSVSVKSVARGTGGPSLSGYFLRPLVGGRRSQGIHGYNGVDIAAPTGTAILAAATGEVIISRNYGYNGGYGQYIVIKHPNGTQTLYAHLSQNFVFAGETVVQGQVIGGVGNTGRSTGPHVHFEVRGAQNPF